ncbi:hypothetical protein OAI90_10115 [Crocinitomicaceae bacterium]|nr:hypothetical protein [Crocinitomicaceae bacterium]
MRSISLLFFLFNLLYLNSQVDLQEIKSGENFTLNKVEYSELTNSRVIIKCLYWNPQSNTPHIYDCIPSGIHTKIKLDIQECSTNTTNSVKLKSNDYKDLNTDIKKSVFYVFIAKSDTLSKILDESSFLKPCDFVNDVDSGVKGYQVPGIKSQEEFCYKLNEVIELIENTLTKLIENTLTKPIDEDPKTFSIELQNTSNLISKYNIPNSNDFSSNYSNINFFEVGADVHFNWSPKDYQDFTVTPGIGYRNSTQGITNKIDNGNYSIEIPEGFISSKNIYLNNIEESIDFNLHSLNVFAGCEYSFKELSISAEIFGRYYIPGTVESRLTAGTFSYRATSNAINEELIDISELGLMENVEAKMYNSQIDKINGFGLGANLNLNYQINNLFIFGGFSFTRNSFSIAETDSNTKLSSELNNYKSTISISEGFKNNTLGLNLGVGYKFK